MISKTFKNNIITLYGNAGKKWLEELPAFLQRQEQILNVKIKHPFEQLTYNYVAPTVLADGVEVVFKCGVPHIDLDTEIAALKHFAGNGAVKLIDANAKEGWLLLERLVPGEMLLSVKNDAESTQIAAQVMQKLWRSIDDNSGIFPALVNWVQIFERLEGNPFPKRLMDSARKLAAELLASQGERVLLHGDLQHYNILSATREPWLAIDPKGVIGEREFEVGALMKNPAPLLFATENPKELFARRIAIITETTNLDRQKMIGWSFIMAMLSACWDYEGHKRHNKLLIHCAENLRGLL